MQAINRHNIKLICSDIDGTLLNKDRWLSEETVTAFAKAQLPLILASSRMPSAMRYLQDGLAMSGSPLIAYNGGLIIGQHNEIIVSNDFSIEVLQALQNHHKAHQYNLSIYSHDYWFTAQEDQWSLREINNTRVTPTYQTTQKSVDFLHKNKLGIHKLMCMGSPEELDSIIALLQPRFAPTVHFYRSKDTYLEITPKHIDKAKALQTLISSTYSFGLEAVIAFGDNHNDDELIKQVGLGIAVANATDTLKGLANYVSPHTNKENAVAQALRKFVIKNQ